MQHPPRYTGSARQKNDNIAPIRGRRSDDGDDGDDDNEIKKLTVHYPWDVSSSASANRLVQLAPSDSAYRTVADSWRAGGLDPSSIRKIERFQDDRKWQKFFLAREAIADQNGGNANEKWLWHGTTTDAVPKILGSSEGFDFRDAGSRVGARFGKGNYFAVEASYSKPYSQSSSGQVAQMFQVRVAVGEYTLGSQDLTKPPLLPGSNFLRYNAVTDSMQKPQMFVTFDFWQQYPMYIVTFQ